MYARPINAQDECRSIRVDAEGRVQRFTRKFGTQTAEQRKTAEKAAKETKKAAAKK